MRYVTPGVLQCHTSTQYGLYCAIMTRCFEQSGMDLVLKCLCRASETIFAILGLSVVMIPHPLDNFACNGFPFTAETYF